MGDWLSDLSVGLLLVSERKLNGGDGGELRVGPIVCCVSGKFGILIGFLMVQVSRIWLRVVVRLLVVTICSKSSNISAHFGRLWGEPWFAAFWRLTVLVSFLNCSFDVMLALWAARAARRVE